MGRFDFQSPGAAMVDEMTKILAERKTEERQRMLDAITQRQDERAALELANAEKHREFLRTNAEEDQLLDRLKIYTSNRKRGDNVEDAPEPFRKLGTELGYFAEEDRAPIPVVTDSVTSMRTEEGEPLEGELPQSAPPPPPAPPKKTLSYVGSAEERKEQEQLRRWGTVITGMLTDEDPRKRENGQLLAQLSTVFGGNIPAEVATRVLTPDQSAFIFDVEAGTIRESGHKIPAGAPVFTQSRPPVQRPQIVNGVTSPDGTLLVVDADGNVRDTGQSIVSRNNQGAMTVGVADSTLKRHEDSVIAVGASDDPTDINNYRTTAKSVIGKATKVTDRVKRIAMAFINNPMVGAQQMMQTDLTPDEKNQLDILINLTEANTYRAKLQAIAVKEKPAPKPAVTPTQPSKNLPITNPKR